MSVCEDMLITGNCGSVCAATSRLPATAAASAVERNTARRVTSTQAIARGIVGSSLAPGLTAGYCPDLKEQLKAHAAAVIAAWREAAPTP